MKADIARKLTIDNRKKHSILPKIYEAIEGVAKNGRNSIVHNGKLPPDDEKELILGGYCIRFYSNPDPGDQRSSDYTVIEW